MALGENQNKIQYTVTTSDDSFEFPYKYWETSDIVVTKLASGVETNPTFTIVATNGDPANGGTVTLDTAVSSCTITIERIRPIESEADYKRGALSPTSLTENFDKQTAISQQIDEKVGRQITHPVSDPAGLDYEAPAVSARASKAAGWDASGNVTALDLSSTGTIAVDTDAGLSMTSNVISAKVDDTSTEFDVSGNISIKDSGVDTAQIADSAVTTAKILDANVTKAKIENVADYKVLGNVSGAPAAPAEVAIIDDETMATATNTNLSTSGAIKGYVDAFDTGSNITTNGYQKFPSGLIIQWGRCTSNTGDMSGNESFTETFPITFPNAVFSVTLTPLDSNGEGSIVANLTTRTTNGFTGNMREVGSVIQNIQSFDWIATGY